MRRWALVLTIVFAIASFGCGKKEVKEVTPEVQTTTVIMTGDWARLEKYPFLKKGELTEKWAQEKSLEKTTIQESMMALNFVGKNKWEGPLNIKGWVVWIDQDGRPWYKDSCGNRLFIPVDHEFQVVMPLTSGPSVPPEKSSISSWGFPWWFLGWIIGIALILAVILGLMWLIRWVFTNWSSRQQNQRPADPQPGAGGGAGGGPGFGPFPPPGPNENGLAVLIDPTGQVRIGGRNVRQESIVINGRHVTVDATFS
jgi:hypothetical protein